MIASTAGEAFSLLTPELILFCLSLGLVALLYGSVGQAGGSGFIAVMALSGFAAHAIKPTALILNVLASAVVALRFWRAGYLSWRALWPFALASAPAAFVGGYLMLPAPLFKLLLGLLLVISALPLLNMRGAAPAVLPQPPAVLPRMIAGGVIGFVSGLTGMGGGILLIPLLLHLRWYDVRNAAALSAVFIFFNSALALVGHWTAGSSLPSAWPIYAIVTMVGGAIGAQLGSRVLPTTVIQRTLAIILLVAGLQLMVMAFGLLP